MDYDETQPPDSPVTVNFSHLAREQQLTLLTSGDFTCLLITFANSLDPDQDRQNVGSELDPICLTI